VTFAELLHKIVDFGEYQGQLDKAAAHEAVESEFPITETGPAPEVGIDASASAPTGPETPEIPEPVVPTPETPATV
jgi:hypothetical protein